MVVFLHENTTIENSITTNNIGKCFLAINALIKFSVNILELAKIGKILRHFTNILLHIELK